MKYYMLMFKCMRLKAYAYRSLINIKSEHSKTYKMQVLNCDKPGQPVKHTVMAQLFKALLTY